MIDPVLVHADFNERGALDKETQGHYISILVRVDYPGSAKSNIRIGSHKLLIDNSDLAAAAKLHEEICDTEGG